MCICVYKYSYIFLKLFFNKNKFIFAHTYQHLYKANSQCTDGRSSNNRSQLWNDPRRHTHTYINKNTGGTKVECETYGMNHERNISLRFSEAIRQKSWKFSSERSVSFILTTWEEEASCDDFIGLSWKRQQPAAPPERWGSTKRGGRRSGWVNSPTIPPQVLISKLEYKFNLTATRYYTISPSTWMSSIRFLKENILSRKYINTDFFINLVRNE